jgi:hypothetical protein
MHLLAANIANGTFLENPTFWEWATGIFLALCLVLWLAGKATNTQQQRGRR